MNIEELKLVMDTIGKISGDASTAAIFWLVLHYVAQMLVPLAWTVAGIYGIKTVAGLLATIAQRDIAVAKHKLNLAEMRTQSYDILTRINRAWGGFQPETTTILDSNDGMLYSSARSTFEKVVDAGPTNQPKA